MAPPRSPPRSVADLSDDPAEELQRQNRRLRAICDLSDALIGEPPLSFIYEAAIAALDAALGPDRASILLIDPDSVMRFKAWRGLSDTYRAVTEGHSPWTAETIDPEPVLVADAAEATDFSEDLRRTVLAEGIRALAFIPVVYQGRLLGKFMLYVDQPHQFDVEEVRIARAIAGHIAFALARVHAANELAGSRDELAIILRDIADGITVQNPDGSLIYANPAAARLIGYPSVERLLATPSTEIMRRFELFDELGHPFPPERLPGRLALQGERPADVICRFRSVATGDERWAIVKATPVLGEGGRVRQAINVFVDITEGRRAVEARARLAAIVQSSDDAIIGKDLDGIIQSWNAGAERLYGYTADEVIGESIGLLMPPELPNELSDIMARLRRNETIDHFESVRVCKDGRRVDVSVSISPIRDTTGQITGAASIARDVTAQKREQRLRRFLTEATTLLAGSLEYQQTLVQVAELAVPDLADWCTVNVVEDGVIRELVVAHVNPAKVEWARQLRERGKSNPNQDEVLQRVIRSGRPELYPLITDADLIAVAHDEEQLRLLREVGFSSAMIVPLKARGRTLGVLVLVSAESGRQYDERDLAVAEDVAWRAALAVDNARLYEGERRARQAAELARDRLALLQQVVVALAETTRLDEVADVVLTHGLGTVGGAAGAIAVVSDDGASLVVVKTVGYPADMVSVWEMFPLTSDVLMAQAARKRQPVWIESAGGWTKQEPDAAAIRQRTGHERYAALPLIVDGQVIGCFGVAFEKASPFDDDERAFLMALAHQCAVSVGRARLFEAERVAREQAQDAIRVRDEFLSVASHELRTPLTSLQAYAQLAIRRGQRTGTLDQEQTGRALDEIYRQAQRLNTLISQLLDISRIQAGHLVLEPQLVDLVPLVEQIVTAARAGAGDRAIELHLPDRLIVMVDGLRLEQVVTNLVDNAVKYSPPGAPVEVSAGQSDRETVEITVRDYGSGIPVDRRAAIFQRFYRAHADTYQSGLGLGLYISQQIVDLHGGTISAEFPEDGGSRFVVRLPLVSRLASGVDA